MPSDEFNSVENFNEYFRALTSRDPQVRRSHEEFIEEVEANRMRWFHEFGIGIANDRLREMMPAEEAPKKRGRMVSKPLVTLRSGRTVRAAKDVSASGTIQYGDDLWDFIHFNCPLSRLEAQVLVGRYILQRGERELADEIGVPWRRLNRATWRLKLKLRSFAKQLGLRTDELP